jgi:hypothetical protein
MIAEKIGGGLLGRRRVTKLEVRAEYPALSPDALDIGLSGVSLAALLFAVPEALAEFFRQPRQLAVGFLVQIRFIDRFHSFAPSVSKAPS